MGKNLHVYNKEAIKKEPFLPMDRPFARSLKIISPVDLEIKWVNATIGNGVFAKQSIKKGAFVCEYVGLITREKDIDPDNRYIFNLTVGDDETGFVLDARYSGNVARTINHADFPNLEAITIFIDGQPRVIYAACRDIQKGEELSVDYGEDYWNTWKEQKR